MPDREKVIKGLNDIGGFIAGRVGFEQARNFLRTIDDALALLKEQEAVVRCKDCVECYFASNRIQSEQTFACGKYGIDVTPDWFCADGGKKVK